MQQIKGGVEREVDSCDQNISYYRIATKHEMVIGFVQFVFLHSDAACVVPLSSSSRKGFTILQSAGREVVQELKVSTKNSRLCH